jgi:hypothetical protein
MAATLPKGITNADKTNSKTPGFPQGRRGGSGGNNRRKI